MSDKLITAVYEYLSDSTTTPSQIGLVAVGANRVPGDSDVKKAVEALVSSGDVLKIKGADIQWNFSGKSPNTWYYIGAERYAAHIKAVADGTEARKRQQREERASDDADLALRGLHPADYRRLYDEALKKLEGK